EPGSAVAGLGDRQQRAVGVDVPVAGGGHAHCALPLVVPESASRAGPMGYHVRVAGPARCRHAPRVAVGGPAALPLSSVPDKRQESKQRRAARNRANREALAARRENAVVSAAPTAKASGVASEAKTTRGGAARGRAGRGTSGTTADAANTTAAPAASGNRPGELFLWIAF